MKYTFQDSTELPLQRDVIQDIQNFVAIVGKVIPIENAAIEKHDALYKEKAALEKGIEELEDVHNKLIKSISELTKESEVKEILDYRNGIIDSIDTYYQQSLTSINSEVEVLNQKLKDENKGIGKQLLKLLNPLFENNIYGTIDRLSVSTNNDILRGKLMATIAGMECESRLAFKHNQLSVSTIGGKLILPTWSKSSLFHKNEAVKQEDVSDFLLKSMDFHGHYLSSSFENRKATKRFKVEIDGDSIVVHYDGNEITADPSLSKSLNINEIKGLLLSLKEHLKTNIAKRQLMKISLDGENAIRNNQTFDCLKIIAEQFTDIIHECMERGYVKDEIIIKLERHDGIRTEKYVSKSHLFEQLSALGSEGLELASILGVDST